MSLNLVVIGTYRSLPPFVVRDVSLPLVAFDS